jgi:hypothetical protein
MAQAAFKRLIDSFGMDAGETRHRLRSALSLRHDKSNTPSGPQMPSCANSRRIIPNPAIATLPG